MCVGVEVGVRGPGVGLHAAQAGGDLRLLSTRVGPLTSLSQQTVGELESQPAMVGTSNDIPIMHCIYLA